MKITIVYLLSFAVGCNGVMAPADPAPRPAVQESSTETEENPMLTAVLLAATLAAPGDVEAILFTPGVALDGPAKVKLGDAITGVFPSADLTKVQNFNCMRDPETDIVSCDGMYDDRQTESVFVDLSIPEEGEGSLVSQVYDTAPEGFVDFKRHAPKKAASTAAKAKIKTFVEAVFTGVAVNLVHDFRCWRDQKDDTVIACRCTYYDTVSSATYVTLIHLKSVFKGIRKVE